MLISVVNTGKSLEACEQEFPQVRDKVCDQPVIVHSVMHTDCATFPGAKGRTFMRKSKLRCIIACKAHIEAYKYVMCFCTAVGHLPVLCRLCGSDDNFCGILLCGNQGCALGGVPLHLQEALVLEAVSCSFFPSLWSSACCDACQLYGLL